MGETGLGLAESFLWYLIFFFLVSKIVAFNFFFSWWGVYVTSHLELKSSVMAYPRPSAAQVTNDQL